MKYIGIDLSYGKPTWIAMLSTDGKLIGTAIIQPRNDLLEHARDVSNYCLGWAVGDKAVVGVESPFVGRNMGVSLNLARLNGMLRTFMTPHGVPLYEIAANSWQQRLLHPKKGQDRKSLSEKRVKKAFKISCESSDMADAINIADFLKLTMEAG